MWPFLNSRKKELSLDVSELSDEIKQKAMLFGLKVYLGDAGMGMDLDNRYLVTKAVIEFLKKGIW